MKRLSAFIVLFASMVILAHAAIPHYHGDNIIATMMHIADDEPSAEGKDAGHCCHHDSDAPHDSSHDSGHCLMNDTMMASVCRPDSLEPDADLMPAICLIYNLPAISDESPVSEIERLDAGDYRLRRGHCDNVHGRRAPPVLQ